MRLVPDMPVIPFPIPHLGRDWRELTPAELEAQRHWFEVRHCTQAGYDYTLDHCRGVAQRRSREAALRIWTDCRRAWAEEKEKFTGKAATTPTEPQLFD